MNKTTKKDIYNIDPRSIVVVDGFNSRTDFGDIEVLAAQIAEEGVLNPITVIPIKAEDGTETYRLVDGERRYRACMHILENGGNIARIPAIFLPKNTSQDELLVQQIIRNEGKPFSEYEYGIAFNKLVKLGYTKEEIAKKFGVKSWKVDICLAHLTRDEQVQKLLREGKITGVDVRHIYQSAKNEQKAVKTIIKLANKTEEKQEKKISLKDLDINDDYVVVKDSAAVKKGLSILFSYVERYEKKGIVLDIDVFDVYEKLHKKMSLKDIFEEPMDVKKAV